MARPELTVREHVKIFSDLKCLAAVNDEVVNSLVKGVDLSGKLPAKAKTLSGGQKRKLQLAMMFAGGSTVCCVDEVSTGLDPISRRRIWEILLAERSRRTIIMTTHFLDEADYLADDIAIMYKGALRASGTSASLKHAHGNGYTVKLPYQTDVEVKTSEPVEKEQSRLLTVYRVPTGVAAAELVEQLECNGLRDYQLSGPTMEELFMKITGDSIFSTENKPEVGQGKHSRTESASRRYHCLRRRLRAVRRTADLRLPAVVVPVRQAIVCVQAAMDSILCRYRFCSCRCRSRTSADQELQQANDLPDACRSY
jgi:ATP-binding cassette subfamily A (ABC1) protein 3